MQLTLDHLQGLGSEIVQIHKKWAMLDFLDRHIHRTGQLIYENMDYHFRIPFQFGEFLFSSYAKPAAHNFCQLTHMNGKCSSLYLKHTLTSLIEIENGFKAVYARFSGSGKGRRLEEDLAGQAYFLLRDYPIQATRFPNLDSTLTQDQVIESLLHTTLHLKVRVNGDWIYEVVSIPFTIEFIEIKGDCITITGSHDLELTIKGFKGLRVQYDHGYIIFDVYDQINGYSRSFYLQNSNGR